MRQQIRGQTLETGWIAVILLLICVAGLVVALSGIATAQTVDYSPNNPYKGMTVTASDSAIQDNEFYDLRVVDEFDGGTVASTSFVEELPAEGTEVVIETDSLEGGEFYLLDGPGLASPTTLTQEGTFELREQTLDVSFGDGDTEAESTENDSASYYGTLTVDGEPAAAGTVVEAVVDGEVYGTSTVEDAGQFGNATETNETLTVSEPAADNRTISFYVVLNDGKRLSTTQSTVWESDTTKQLDLSVDFDQPPEDTAADNMVSNDTSQTASDSNQTVTEESEDTTETTPGFGIITAIGSLTVIFLLRYRSTRIE